MYNLRSKEDNARYYNPDKNGDRGKATMPAVYLLASKDEADKKEKQRGDRTEEEEEERGHVRRSIGP